MSRVRLAWRLGVDAYNGVERVQMVVVGSELALARSIASDDSRAAARAHAAPL
jgi:hypothetical protein